LEIHYLENQTMLIVTKTEPLDLPGIIAAGAFLLLIG